MKSAVFFALLPTLLSATSVLAVAPIPQKISNLPTVPNKFIIEVDDLASIPNKRSFTRSLDAVYSALNARDVQYEVNKEYDTDGVFVGAALTLSSAEDVRAVEETPGVKAIRPVRAFKQPILAKKHVVTGHNDPELPADTLSTHVMTGVDKLHAEGNVGAGIKIGIIDTGIDYKHASLGGGIGGNFLVAGGYDFVGDAYNGNNDPVPDADPYDNCNGHGTHVAGIIAAQPGNEYNITGVAYGSKIYSYRVFGCSGSVTEEVLVDALIRGYKDGNDILTLSLGGADGWSASSSAIVAGRLADLGKIVTIAAGNDGAAGSWYSSSPGNAHDVISVASVENTVISLQSAIVHGATYGPIVYFGTRPFPVTTELPIYAISNSTTISNDACDPLPDSTPDLSSYLVIVRRGSCTFITKLANIAAKGGKATLIYDNGNGFAGISVGTYVATLIQAADGEFLVNQFAAGDKISISFPQTGGAVDFPSETGGLVSTFTSYGPSNDFYFKPAVAAPGGNILSTYPLALGGFAVLSGTSMATPFLAGTSALYLNAKGKSAGVAKAARDVFETTATKIPSSKTDGDPLQTLTQAGAGLVDAYKAIHGTTVISPGELVLNDTAHFKGIQTFTVKNTGRTNKRYTLSHVPAGTALTIQEGSILAEVGPVPLSTNYASVTVVPSSFSLAPGRSQVVVAVIKPPAGVDASRYPIYSGFIDVTSASDVTHVSYLGLVGSLKNKQVVDNTDAFFGIKTPVIIDATGNWQEAATNYTFANGDWPSLLWKLAFGTPALRVDLVSAAINLKPTLSARGFPFGPFFTFPTKHRSGSYAQVKIVGPLASFDYIPRHDDLDNAPYSLFNLETSTFANGTTIPSGTYRVLLRALRVTGNPLLEEDYESWLSPIVGITAP
ncbi:pyrolysin [Pholiota conissans]|uniref:Pyrolysin n=1 Tax=Pholiota conissans TaxID=109636 RepID=A0A9P5YVL5_9AGAR|nr:pyrolysin [Pholiota conissans]